MIPPVERLLVDNNALRRALRLLQVYDELSSVGDGNRPVLMLAQDALGEMLGLECTGERQGEGWYDHNGDTCPVHEWIDPRDGEHCIAWQESEVRRQATG